MKIIIFCFFIISCSSLDTKNNNKDVADYNWSIIENSNEKLLSLPEVKNLFGEPVRSYQYDDGTISLIYFNKKTNFQEWAFAFHGDKITGITYIPQAPFRNDFTLDKILKRWKDLNCKKIEEPVITSHTINTKTYMSCDKGRRIVNYNRYNEVSSIYVKK